MSTETKEKKVKDMTEKEKKEYAQKKAHERKTNEFFKQSAEIRVNQVLKALNRVKQLSRYNGTDEQVNKIIETIETETQDTFQVLRHTKKDKETFKL